MTLRSYFIRNSFTILILWLLLRSIASFAIAENQQDLPEDFMVSNIFNTNSQAEVNKAEIPTALLSLGGYPSSYALIVEKLQHRLSVYKTNPNGDYDLVKTYKAITGKKPGDKKSTGDKRTPEGIYFITGKISGNKLPPKYGPGALTLDYPNVFDQRMSKTGYGIWIHGVEDDSRVHNPFDTDGCVALKNSDWRDLEKYISPLDTPVIISKEMNRVSSKYELERQKNEILDLLDSWKLAWESSNLNDYINFYSDSFTFGSYKKAGWLNMKQNLSEMNEGKIKIEISEPKILAFDDQVLISFYQKYESKSNSDFGKKFLYLQKEDNKHYKIIFEKWYKDKIEHFNALVRQNNEFKFKQ